MKFNREQFVADALALTTQNIPWRHQGRDPRTGLDCIGLLRYLYETQGLVLPEELVDAWSAYHTNTDGRLLMALLRKYFIEIPVDSLRPADLLVMYIQKRPKHMAVMVTEETVVEAFQSQCRAVCRVLERRLKANRRIAACFRIPDFA